MFSTIVKFIYKTVMKVKPLLRKIISKDVWFAIKPLLPNQFVFLNVEKIFINEWREARATHPWPSGSNESRTGINLIGYFQAVKGISEAARSSTLALDAARIPYTIIDYEFGVPVSQHIVDLPISQYGNSFKFNTNLIHVNPPQLPFLWDAFKNSDLITPYSIGVWYWELPEFPEEWCFAFDLVDEVWVATQFIFDSVFAKSPVPVVKIPPCIQTTYDHRMNRSDYNLPTDRFLFMCAYDVLSVQARKNPMGAIEAFKRAFQKNDQSVGLVIKVNNAAENPREIQDLRDNLKEYSNCYIIDDVFDKLKFNSLLNLVDVYVSLHRSEGFGLVPAEAMNLGKPVIMTRWSGNVDLMTPDNSCGVDYTLIPLSKQSGPYMLGQYWADPDIGHAEFFMHKLFSDGEFYSQISSQAKKTIHDNFSSQIVGQLINERMQKIGLSL